LIRELTCHNFKPFGSPQSARLAPLTLIYGPNSSGKSSVIQALLLLRQSMSEQLLPDYPLRPRGDMVDLGSYRSLMYKHDANLNLGLRLTYDPPLPDPGGSESSAQRGARELGGAPRTLALTFSGHQIPGVGQHTYRPSLDKIGYGLEQPTGAPDPSKYFELARTDLPKTASPRLGAPDQLCAYCWADDSALNAYSEWVYKRTGLRDEIDLFWDWSQPALYRAYQTITRSSVRRGGTRLALSDFKKVLDACVVIGAGSLPFRCWLRPLEASIGDLEYHRLSFVAPLLDVFASEFKSALKSIDYLGPLRNYPERHYLLGPSPALTVGKRGENTPQVLYYRTQEVIQGLEAWFKLFGIPYGVKLRPFGDEIVGEMMVINLTDSRTQTQVTPSDVGFGLGQMLPILVQGIVPGAQTICVEQPEIHLHPRLQSTMADFLAWSAGILETTVASPKQPKQWIVETHSEVLMLRLQRRISEGKLDPAKLSVLYVNPIQDVGAVIQDLRIESNGEFADPWPDGFFTEGFRELFHDVNLTKC
jgi:hypothetical protein